MGHIAGKETTHDKVSILEEHVHQKQEVFPASANSVQLTASTTAWQHGTKVQVIAAGVVNDHFDVHWVLISGISANGEYEVKIYAGAPGSEVEIATIATVRNAVQSVEGSTACMTKLMEPGTRISASVASGNAVADTLNVKLVVHEY